MNKILIVDDDVAIQILYADELTEEGYEVITTGDGVGLLGLIEEAQPDLVVLDIRLGEFNGLDLLQVRLLSGSCEKQALSDVAGGFLDKHVRCLRIRHDIVVAEPVVHDEGHFRVVVAQEMRSRIDGYVDLPVGVGGRQDPNPLGIL